MKIINEKIFNKVKQLQDSGHLVVTKPGLLTQDFQTYDGYIKVYQKRYGHGFGAGFTYNIVEKNGEILTENELKITQRMKHDTELVFKMMINYLENKKKIKYG